MDQDETWYVGRPRPWPYCVRWGPSSPPPKGHSPEFSAHVCCGQTAGCIRMPLGRKVGLVPGDIVLDGDAAPLPRKDYSSPTDFSIRVCCGQTAGWIKMPLGTEVGLGPGDILLDGDPAPLKRRTAPSPLCGPCLLWPAKRSLISATAC